MRSGKHQIKVILASFAMGLFVLILVLRFTGAIERLEDAWRPEPSLEKQTAIFWSALGEVSTTHSLKINFKSWQSIKKDPELNKLENFLPHYQTF